MGKKGSKRKTRWRTLSIDAPPGEEDEEDDLRNGYVKGEQNGNSPRGFDRSGQGDYKPRRSTVGSSGSSGYSNGSSRTRRDESTGSPSQSNNIFNEDEYTRITTPRQDILFKKGYLSRKKPWAGNASTSATPSTTESHSASHSTADGSETTEDQQLLDRDSVTNTYPERVDPRAQVGYGTFYDHYYYAYPVMLVGPAPIPTEVGPSVLAALPCGSVPLKPIEWIDPAFVPELSGQSCCVMDNEVHYQSTETQPTTAKEHENALVPVENSNGAWNENGTGSASCSGSVAEEIEEQQLDETNVTKEVAATGEDNPTEKLFQDVEQGPIIEETDGNGAPYLEPIVMPQPVTIHVSHVMPTVPQPYMYPGHYMFGPPLVNVNGVTIQGGPMIRTTNMMDGGYIKQRKKKKRRKQRGVVLVNAEEDEEGYSSDGESGLSSSRTSWSTSLSTATITTVTTTATTTTTSTTKSRPLNPECKEFQLRKSSTTSKEADQLLADTSAALKNEEGISSNNGDNYELTKYNNDPCKDTTSTEEEETKVKEKSHDPSVESMTTNQSITDSLNNPENRLINYLSDDNEIVSSKETMDYVINDARTESNEASRRTDINNVADSLFSANEICERPASDVNNFSTKLNVKCDKEPLSNGQIRSNRLNNDTEMVQLSSDSIESTVTMENGTFSETPRSSRSSSNQLANERTIVDNSIDTRQAQDSSDSSSTRENTRKKYNTKSIRIIREATPGPNLNDECDTNETVENLAQTVASSKIESTTHLIKKNTEADDLISSESASEMGKDNADNKTVSEDVADGSNDSGFETQTRHPEYRITEAVTEWLRRANSPDVFITTTSMISDSSDSEDEDLDDEPPKNLQGNPMPALSVNSMADDRVSSCTASCSEFAKINNVEEDRHAHNNKNDHQSAMVTLKRTYVRGSKKKLAERFAKQVESNNCEPIENGILSSSDSCHQQESIPSTTTLRKRNLLRKDVVGVCEFTEKDSVAGMRVATSSRIHSKRSTSRRAKRSEKSNRKPAESLDVKIRHVNEPFENEAISDDIQGTMSVRTFEKGEIVVSVDGKFLQISPLARLLHYVENNVSKNEKKKSEEISLDKKIANSSEETGIKRLESTRRSSDEEDETDKKMTSSLVSIEEPDVLECWEVETIEPIRTPKKMLQSHGISYEGEAAEEDHFQAEPAIVEHVQKYYRLARESATSIEDESYESKINVLLETKPFNKSRMVPNSPVELIRGYQGEEIPVIMPNEKYGNLEERKIPVDEAFEVYESCYTDRTQSSALNSIFKTRPLYRQEGEGPVPCRAVCCSIQ